jgi:hypothetical protein
MAKIKLVGASIIVVMIGVLAVKRMSTAQVLSSLSLANIEALATGESTGTETGPKEFRDCPYWNTGERDVCMCTNSNYCAGTRCPN